MSMSTFSQINLDEQQKLNDLFGCVVGAIRTLISLSMSECKWYILYHITMLYIDDAAMHILYIRHNKFNFS